MTYRRRQPFLFVEKRQRIMFESFFDAKCPLLYLVVIEDQVILKRKSSLSYRAGSYTKFPTFNTRLSAFQ